MSIPDMDARCGDHEHQVVFQQMAKNTFASREDLEEWLKELIVALESWLENIISVGASFAYYA